MHLSHFVAGLAWMESCCRSKEEEFTVDLFHRSERWKRTSTPFNRYFWGDASKECNELDLKSIPGFDVRDELVVDSNNNFEFENEFWTEDFDFLEIRDSGFKSFGSKLSKDAPGCNQVFRGERESIIITSTPCEFESKNNSECEVNSSVTENEDADFDINISAVKSDNESWKDDLKGVLNETANSELSASMIKSNISTKKAKARNDISQEKLLDKTVSKTSGQKNNKEVTSKIYSNENLICKTIDNEEDLSKEIETKNDKSKENLEIKSIGEELNISNSKLKESISKPKRPSSWRRKFKCYTKNYKDSKTATKKRNIFISCLIGEETTSPIDLSRNDIKVNESKKQSVIEFIDEFRSKENNLKLQESKSSSKKESKTSIKSKRSQGHLSNRQRSMGNMDLRSQKEKELEKGLREKQGEVHKGSKKTLKNKFLKLKRRKLITNNKKDRNKTSILLLSEGSQTRLKDVQRKEVYEPKISQGSQADSGNFQKHNISNEIDYLREDIVNEIERRIIQEATLHKYLTLW